MKITESKLRQMIRGVIREFVSTGTAAGAQKGGYESADTTSKETAYDKKLSTYNTKKSAVDKSKQYRKAGAGRGSWDYSATGGKGWSKNPDYTTQVNARDAAETSKDSAKTTWNSAKEVF